MLHQILETLGLGVLGIDFMAAAVALSMGARGERKANVAALLVTFAVVTVGIGTVLAVALGTAASRIIQGLIPADDSPLWAIVELGIGVVVLAWMARRVCGKKGREDEGEGQRTAEGSILKFVALGAFFGVTSFTDPTCYGVVLLGGKSGSPVMAALLMLLWFVISQFGFLATCVAVLLGATERLTALVEGVRGMIGDRFTKVVNMVLLAVALLLIVDPIVYLVTGSYLF